MRSFLKNGLCYFFSIQTTKQKFTLFSVLVLTFLAAYFEFKILTLIGPMVAVIGGSAAIGHAEGILNWHQTGPRSELAVWYLAIQLAIFAVLSAATRIAQIYVGHSYIYGLGHRLGALNLANAIGADYVLLKNSHSSQLLARFERINIAINSVLNPLLILTSSLIIGSAIVASLFNTDPLLSLVCLLCLSLFFFASGLFSRSAILRNSNLLNQVQGERIFLIREAISGYRELKLGAMLGDYARRFNDVDRSMRAAQVMNLVLGSSPRFLLEALGLIALAIVLLVNSAKADAMSEIVSVLATFAVGAQRLLPHAQSIYSSIASIAGHMHMINDLAQPLFPETDAKTKHPQMNANPFLHDFEELRCRNVSYTYPGSNEPALVTTSLLISRGDKIALVGTSGSGKSTFLELLCGLLRPTTGTIEVDGIAITSANVDEWQQSLAYVPQQPFLTSGSVRENLLLGSPEGAISEEQIATMLRRVGLEDWLTRRANGLDRPVGENGSNLSGGQKQRLAIARALIGSKKILVMDEITSNLDAANESAILDLILNLPRDYTLICSLHKVSRLDRFDAVVEFGKGASIMRVPNTSKTVSIE